jgi:hypothetical protein
MPPRSSPGGATETVHGGVRTTYRMLELWRLAPERRAEFDAGALEYDRSKPRHPDPVFGDVLCLGAWPGGSFIA